MRGNATIAGVVLCQQCEAEGIRSVVTRGTSSMTALHCPGFFDERGVYHQHDRNAVVTSYSCSRFHWWSETTYPRCWCGWTAEPKESAK